GCGSPDKPPPVAMVDQKATISCVTIARGLMPGSVSDADISASNPASTYGTNALAPTGNAPSTPPLGRRLHAPALKFDRSADVPPSTPGVQPPNVPRWQHAPAPAQIQVFPLGVPTPAPWTEAGVTWNVINTPPQTSLPVTSFNVAAGQAFTAVTFPLSPQAL